MASGGKVVNACVAQCRVPWAIFHKFSAEAQTSHFYGLYHFGMHLP